MFGYPLLLINITSLPTERKRRTGEYLPEVVAGTDRAQGDPYKKINIIQRGPNERSR